MLIDQVLSLSAPLLIPSVIKNKINAAPNNRYFSLGRFFFWLGPLQWVQRPTPLSWSSQIHCIANNINTILAKFSYPHPSFSNDQRDGVGVLTWFQFKAWTMMNCFFLPDYLPHQSDYVSRFLLVQIKGSIIFQLQQRQCLPSWILTSNLLLRLPCFVSAPLHAWESHMLVFLALGTHSPFHSFICTSKY